MALMITDKRTIQYDDLTGYFEVRVLDYNPEFRSLYPDVDLATVGTWINVSVETYQAVKVGSMLQPGA